MKHLKPAAVVAAILASIPAFAAEGQPFLPTQTTVAILADGVPWSAASPSGRTFKLTLNKNGTGSIDGPLFFTLSVNWTVKGDAMCISGTMMSKCLRFRKVSGGFQSWDEEGKPDLTFSR